MKKKTDIVWYECGACISGDYPCIWAFIPSPEDPDGIDGIEDKDLKCPANCVDVNWKRKIK